MNRKQEIEEILDLFTHPGWAKVVEDIDTLRGSTDTIVGILDTLELGRRQGRLEQLEWFVRLKEWYQASLDLIEGEDA